MYYRLFLLIICSIELSIFAAEQSERNFQVEEYNDLGPLFPGETKKETFYAFIDSMAAGMVNASAKSNLELSVYDNSDKTYKTCKISQGVAGEVKAEKYHNHPHLLHVVFSDPVKKQTCDWKYDLLILTDREIDRFFDTLEDQGIVLTYKRMIVSIENNPG